MRVSWEPCLNVSDAWCSCACMCECLKHCLLLVLYMQNCRTAEGVLWMMEEWVPLGYKEKNGWWVEKGVSSQNCRLWNPAPEQAKKSRLAQLVERETVNLEVSGSIPLVRAFALLLPLSLPFATLHCWKDSTQQLGKELCLLLLMLLMLGDDGDEGKVSCHTEKCAWLSSIKQRCICYDIQIAGLNSHQMTKQDLGNREKLLI